jgi:hypothetical protein
MEIPTVPAMNMRTLNTARWVASARASRTETSASAGPAGELIEYETGDGYRRDPSLATAHNPMTLATVQAAYASI